MAASIVIHDEQEEVEIPGGIRTLAEFRRWLHSDAFPERGRIDYLDGRIEVDLAPRSHMVRRSAR